jgi:uncharacterized protein (DUF362 family)
VRFGRREFAAGAILGTAAAACGACAATPPGSRRHSLPDGPRAPEESAVAVVRPAAFPSLRAAVARAIALAGGLSFVRPGQSVLLKPAVNSGKAYPATTDPEIVYAVAELVKEAGGRPLVADRTMFLRSTEAAFRKTGILDAARQAGMPCLALDGAEVVAVRHPLARSWSKGTVRIYRAVEEADHVVNLCTPRTHGVAGFTMAMKNLVGIVDGSARIGMHLGSGLAERLAELSLLVRPALVVLDGRLGFAHGGPDEGDLCRPGFLAAGPDPLAVDAVGLAFLRLAGADDAIGKGSIWRIPIMARAAEIGVGAAGPDRIRLVGLAPDDEARLRPEMA